MPIIVRHSEARDIEAIRTIYSQPGNVASTLQLPFPSAELWEQRLARRHENFYSLVACSAERVLGQIGIEVFAAARRKHAANIGLAVDAQSRRSGVGAALVGAALELCHGWLAVTRVELETYTDNAAAIGLFEAHGFTVEGRAIDYAFRAGQYVDVLLMAHCVRIKP